jgi:hypothetical protein
LYTISDIGLSTCTKQKYVSEVPSEFFETIWQKQIGVVF